MIPMEIKYNFGKYILAKFGARISSQDIIYNDKLPFYGDFCHFASVSKVRVPSPFCTIDIDSEIILF